MSSGVMRGKGQVTIPADIRKAAHLEEGDPVEIEMVAEGILIKPRKTIDATQAWFWAPRWQAGEAEASAELARREGRAFASSEDFLASFDEE